MEFVIGAISLSSLILNYLIYRRITTTHVLGTVEEFELATAHLCQCEAVKPVESEMEIEVKEPPKPPKNQAQGAWTNRKEIPWVPPVKPPEPIIKPVNRGPLARPDGFV